MQWAEQANYGLHVGVENDAMCHICHNISRTHSSDGPCQGLLDSRATCSPVLCDNLPRCGTAARAQGVWESVLDVATVAGTGRLINNLGGRGVGTVGEEQLGT